MPAKRTHNNRSRLSQENAIYHQNEQDSEIKDIKSLKFELHQWNHAYNEILKIFTGIITITDDTSTNNSNKPHSMIKLCREVAKIAKDPKNTKEYKDLLKSMQDCKDKMMDLSQKNAAMINDVYDFSQTSNYDYEQPERTQMTIRLNNLDTILSREIEQNKQYLTDRMPNLQTATKEEPQLTKKQSNVLPTPQKKKNKSIFPSVSQLLSPSFNKRTKNNIFMFTPEHNDLQNSFDVNENRGDFRVTIVKNPAIQLNQQNQNYTKISKSSKSSKEEIPFGKRTPRKNSRSRTKSRKT